MKIVTPLYYYGMSAQLKTLIDRFCAFNTSIQRKHMKSALLTVAWNNDTWTFEALESHYDTLVRYLNLEYREEKRARNQCGGIGKAEFFWQKAVEDRQKQKYGEYPQEFYYKREMPRKFLPARYGAEPEPGGGNYFISRNEEIRPEEPQKQIVGQAAGVKERGGLSAKPAQKRFFQ